MVAFLEKSTGSEGFHQVIDFLARSHICYALTKKPAVSVSFIKQFWRSAEATTDDNGEVKIIATIDGYSMTITEASLRRHLKLDDQDGITSIPNSEIFEQLALMGYHTDSDKLTFQKGAFSPQWRFLIHNILHCLSPKKTAWEQFSSNIATAVICLQRDIQARKLLYSLLCLLLLNLLLLLQESHLPLQPYMNLHIHPHLNKKKEYNPRKRRIFKRQTLEEDAEKEDTQRFLDIIKKDVAKMVESLSQYPNCGLKTYTFEKKFMYIIFQGEMASPKTTSFDEMQLKTLIDKRREFTISQRK
ncbi:hypothetical protein Tco_0850272, partial [Tanacetum coccineum]